MELGMEFCFAVFHALGVLEVETFYVEGGIRIFPATWNVLTSPDTCDVERLDLT